MSRCFDSEKLYTLLSIFASKDNQMSWNPFKKKSEDDLKNTVDKEKDIKPQDTTDSSDFVAEELFANPFVCSRNFLELFNTVPEVFFPIDYIASRVAGATFQLKKAKDDSIVWDNQKVNQILNKPNCLFSWKETVYSHHVYKLCVGDSFFRAAIPESFSKIKNLWQWCSNYWVLPADKVEIVPVRNSIPCLELLKLKK